MFLLLLACGLGLTGCFGKSDKAYISNIKEISGLVTEKGYTGEDFQDNLLGKTRNDIIIAWGSPDGSLFGSFGDVWYLSDESNKHMFLSNTATAAMMLTFLTPVLKSLPADGKGKIGLAMSIPVAANIGGMGTPIGTPPNAIALKYLNDPEGLNLNIGFGEWMGFMMPYTIVILFIAWFIMLRLFPFKQKTIELQIDGEAKKDWRSILVYVTFAITVLLWMSDKFTGVNSNVVAMIPVAVFCVTGVITKRDLEEISWSVLWMVAGGFALGVALQETGLAQHMIKSIPFNTWPPVLMIVGSGLICYAMANFISHTATAALLVPILAIAGISMRDNLATLGGVETLLIGVAVGSSLAMVLPISTPPNALAHATGMIQQKDMEKVGLIMGAIGLVLGYTMLIILGSNGLL